MSFEVRFVGSEALVPPALWQDCFAPPLEGRWWYAALEQAGLESQFTFHYGVIHADGSPVGIAPAFVMGFPVSMVAPRALLGVVRLLGKMFRAFDRPRTLFVGSPCADEGNVGLLPGVDRRAALLVLQSALEDKANEIDAALLVWKDVPTASREALDGIARRRRLFRLASFPGTVAELPAGGKPAYLAALQGRRRYRLRKKLRLSASHTDLRVEILQAPGGPALEAFYALYRQTYAKAAVRFEDLNLRFFELLARRPEVHFVVLKTRVSGDAVAFMLCFDMGATIINKFIGIDYRRPAEWFLYFRLWDAAVDWAISRGARSIQSGQTGYRAKLDIGHRLVPLYNYCRFRNPAVHAIGRLFARRIDWSTLDDDLAEYLRAHPEGAA